MRVAGADEAGKGPVLGSMFAAAVAAPGRDVLPDDVADSKTLSPERRTALAASIRETPEVAVGLAEVPPNRIDDPATDMNTLTVTAQAEALNAVAADGLTCVVDASDVNPTRFARRLDRRLDPDVTVEARHRADETDDLVASASIIAKVERDAHVEALAAEYGAVGSGYPSDPTTRTFLAEYVRDHGELPPCARASWATSRTVLEAADQAALDEF